MPIGNEVGSFTSNVTSMTKSTDSAGNHTFVINVEGTVSGGWSGTVVGTITGSSKDFVSGSYSADFAAYLDDGSALSGQGSGVLAAEGNHKWQLNGVALISEGSRVATEGSLELSNRSYNGKMYAIS